MYCRASGIPLPLHSLRLRLNPQFFPIAFALTDLKLESTLFAKAGELLYSLFYEVKAQVTKHPALIAFFLPINCQLHSHWQLGSLHGE